MKKTYSILMIAFMVTVLVACKKDKDDNPTDIKGTWELAEYATSWVPNQTYAPGNGNLMEIKSDSYTISFNGELKEQGNYTTTPDGTVEENVGLINLKDKYTTRIELTNVTPSRYLTKYFFYIEDNKLYLIGGYFPLDGGMRSVYRRAGSAEEGK